MAKFCSSTRAYFNGGTEASIQLHKACIMLHTVSRKSCFQFRDYVGHFIILEEGG